MRPDGCSGMSRIPFLLQDTLLSAAEAGPERTAIVAGGRRYSYCELREQSLRLARALQELGLRRGDRVIVQLDNSWEAAVAVYGILLAGGVFSLVGSQTKPAKLAFLLDDAQAAVLICEPRVAGGLTAAGGRPRSLRSVIVRGAGGKGSLSLDDLLVSAEAAPADPGTIPLDLAALIYTSGSTGHPKGVMMTHQSMLFTAESVSRSLRLSAEERILCFLPLSFDYGLYQLLMAVHLGAALVLERSFAYPAHVLARARDEQVTVFPGVPTVFAAILSRERTDELHLESVTRVTNTAAAMPPGFVPRLRRVFPNALLFLMYGLTECKRVSYLEPELVEEKPGSVGRAIPGTEAFVLLPDGRRARPGQAGILHVRGPHVMAGYWRRPDLTREMLREGPLPGQRILCTQDWFATDEDGFLYFLGRSDDIIKTGGEKVSPVEVEDVLYAIEGVREAAVVGEPDELLGQAICAYLVLEPDAELAEQDVKRLCRERLEGFMVPRRVVFVAELPKSEAGKIRRRELAGPAPAGA